MAKRQKHEEHENHERWLVSYADFITLLFAFFVVMYATSNKDPVKQKQFEGSIRNTMNIGMFGGGYNPLNMQVGSEMEPIGKQMKNALPIDMQSYYQKKINSRLSKEEKGGLIQDITYDSSGVRIRLQSSNLFKPGQTSLNPSSFLALGKLAIILKNSNRPVIVEGHTDNQKFEGSGEVKSNWELGALRATNVVRLFIEEFEIPAKQLSAATHADTKPIAENDTAQGRSDNRRIEIFIPAATK
jgi:chemotaxis protein MotB